MFNLCIVSILYHKHLSIIVLLYSRKSDYYGAIDYTILLFLLVSLVGSFPLRGYIDQQAYIYLLYVSYHFVILSDNLVSTVNIPVSIMV
jgi:hypothetical protein